MRACAGLHTWPLAGVNNNVRRLIAWTWLLCLPAGRAADLAAILRRVEARYNRAQTLEVAFEQFYQGQGRAWKPERGRLWLRKPGRMRWEYTQPAGKLFVTDGKYAWLYTPESKQVERTRLKETEDLRAPLAFLLGRLDFQRDFKRFLGRPEGDGYRITAEPKSDRLVYTEVEFLVDGRDRIRQLRIRGQDRSIMEFRFQDERINPPLREDLFVFRAPAGTTVVESNL